MSKNTASYVSFVAALTAACQELGVPVTVEERAGWVKFESTVNKHKFYVPKSVTVMGLCETTLPVQHLNGARPMPKDNGKIKSKFIADLDLIQEHILPLLCSTEDSLPENRKPSKADKTAATPSTPPSGRVGTLEDIL